MRINESLLITYAFRGGIGASFKIPLGRLPATATRYRRPRVRTQRIYQRKPAHNLCISWWYRSEFQNTSGASSSNSDTVSEAARPYAAYLPMQREDIIGTGVKLMISRASLHDDVVQRTDVRQMTRPLIPDACKVFGCTAV